jgi:hypothetical protein
MRMPLLIRVVLSASVLMGSADALAGPYADDMAKCLVNSTAPADRSTFVKWFFTAIALQPDVRSMASVTDTQRNEINRQVGELFNRMLFDTCRIETERALRYEGPQTLQYAFQVFGQAAARELVGNPSVAADLAGVSKFVDAQRLRSLMSPPLPDDPGPVAPKP